MLFKKAPLQQDSIYLNVTEKVTLLGKFHKKKPLHQSTMLFSCNLDKMQSLRPTLRIKSSGCRRK